MIEQASDGSPAGREKPTERRHTGVAGSVALLAVPQGALRGFLAALIAPAFAAVTYLALFRRWVVRWGATDDKAGRPMPGDDIVPRCTTRAITIDVPAAQAWPWLVQLGYGRAGWYSDHVFKIGGSAAARRSGPNGNSFAGRRHRAHLALIYAVVRIPKPGSIFA